MSTINRISGPKPTSNDIYSYLYKILLYLKPVAMVVEPIYQILNHWQQNTG